MYKKFKNNKGVALVSVLMVFVVLFILGIGLLQVAMADTNQSSWQANRVQAHYLGRSGVHHGIELLESKLTGTTPYTGTIGSLASSLQSQVGTSTYEIPNVGTYTIRFEEGLYAGQIKIISVGTSTGNPSSSQTVTYIKELGDTFSFTNPASEWMTGINLDKNISPSNVNKSYLGQAVLLQTKNAKNSVQSPKGSGASTFQASIVAFREYDGRSLRQITNSIDMTFDAEIILFIGDILLNKTGDDLILTISPDVLKQKTYDKKIGYTKSPSILNYGPSIPPSPAAINTYAVGFEDYERYKYFATQGDSSVSLALSSWSLGNFETGKNYGVVKLGGGINVDDGTPVLTVSDKGYYYFKNGVNLRNPGVKGLVKINDNDPIVKILDSLLGVSIGTQPPLWNDK